MSAFVEVLSVSVLKRLENEREQVASVARRWKAQYFHGGKWSFTNSGASSGVYERLVALPSDATASDVAAIIGNDSWIGHRCDGCGKTSLDAWQIGDEPDYESHTVTLCRRCMDALVAAYKADPHA